MKKYYIFLILFCLIFCGCKEASPLPSSNISPIAVNDIVINKSHAYVDEGEKIILLAQVFPFNADNQKIHWKSDNENIAVVDGGIVIGKNEGRTVITATSDDGEISDKCIVYVSYPKLNYEDYPNNLNFEQQSFKTKSNENVDIFNLINNKIYNQINSFNESIKSIQDFFDNIKLKYEIYSNENTENINFINNQNTTQGNGYEYSYQCIYNSNGVEDEEDENIIYKDDNTIIKEKIKQLWKINYKLIFLNKKTIETMVFIFLE